MKYFGKVKRLKSKEKVVAYSSGKQELNANTINTLFDFDSINDCRRFLNNFYIGPARVKAVILANGNEVKMEDIPDDQVIQRAKEFRAAIFGKPDLIK